MRRWTWLAGALLLLPVCSPAQDRLDPDRPDVTESTKTVPLGRFQIEGGYTYTRLNRGDFHSLGEILARFGLDERSELRVTPGTIAWSRRTPNNASGVTDAGLGIKVRLSGPQEEYGLGRPTIGFIGQTTIPTGSGRFRNNKAQPEGKLLLEWRPSEASVLGVNVNYGYFHDTEWFTQLSGSVSYMRSLNETWRWFVEYFGAAPSGRLRRNTNYIDGGLLYDLAPDTVLDLRAGIGLNGNDSDYFLGVGATKRI